MLGVINTGNINATLRRNISYHIDAAGAMLQIAGGPSFVVATSYELPTRVPFVVFLTVINSALLSLLYAQSLHLVLVEDTGQ